MINSKILVSGVFHGDEYNGRVIELNGKFEGLVHQVPGAGEETTFVDVSREAFDTFEEAEEYVLKEWSRKFEK